MLKIDIPVRLLRCTVQRCSQFYKGRPKGPDGAPQTENDDLIPADQTGIRNNRRQMPPAEVGSDRIFVFFRGVARAGGIGLLVAVILAAMPWFEPDVQPFQTRLVDFVQQYAIPICSALLIWYGLRAAL